MRIKNILLGLYGNRYSEGGNNEFWDCKATLLKLRQNKKDRIFVCHACQNKVFLQLEAEKKTHFGEHNKQISNPKIS